MLVPNAREQMVRPNSLLISAYSCVEECFLIG
jgi:hypothetical protein